MTNERTDRLHYSDFGFSPLGFPMSFGKIHNAIKSMVEESENELSHVAWQNAGCPATEIQNGKYRSGCDACRSLTWTFA
jgi:hypothetical protein